MLYLLREYGIPLMGCKVDLVRGIVPIECLLFTVVLFGLGMRDLGTAVAYLQRWRDTRAEKEEYMDT